MRKKSIEKEIEDNREELRKARAKIREIEEYCKTLEIKDRQLCDEAIVIKIREMSGNTDIMETLRMLQNQQNEKTEGEEK